MTGRLCKTIFQGSDDAKPRVGALARPRGERRSLWSRQVELTVRATAEAEYVGAHPSRKRGRLLPKRATFVSERSSRGQRKLALRGRGQGHDEQFNPRAGI